MRAPLWAAKVYCFVETAPLARAAKDDCRLRCCADGGAPGSETLQYLCELRRLYGLADDVIHAGGYAAIAIFLEHARRQCDDGHGYQTQLSLAAANFHCRFESVL